MRRGGGTVCNASRTINVVVETRKPKRFIDYFMEELFYEFYVV